MPNHYGGDLLHTMAISGLSRVRTELLHLAVIPSAPPHPVQLDGQFPGHRDLRDLSSAPHSQMKELATPLRMTAHRDLGRFHQQKAQQRVALLADVSQPSSIPARFFRRNQSHVAGNLLRAGTVPVFQSPTRTPVRSTQPTPGRALSCRVTGRRLLICSKLSRSVHGSWA